MEPLRRHLVGDRRQQGLTLGFASARGVAADFAAVGQTSGFNLQRRNLFRGPIYTGFNLGLYKSTPIHRENIRLTAGIQAFNLLNHPNFTNPPGYIQFGQYGFQSQQMLNNGLGGLNPIFQQGGPRSLQLSLRLSF